MKLVFVSGPFRAKTPWLIEKNIRLAEEWALKCWQAGAATICPHANTRFYDGSAPDSLWLKGDLEILRRCDAVLMIPDWEKSKGATGEAKFAVEHNIPVFKWDDFTVFTDWVKSFD